MRKFLISVICATCMGAAFAAGENVATSKAFVDTAVAQKQDKIPANSGATQVLTNTGTAGTVGTKDIYTASGEYVDQKDSLIDAQTMNAAVQNAINAEFKCVQYNPNDSTDCWLVDIGAPALSALPTGYTALEYIEAQGNTYNIINTQIILTADFDVHIEGMAMTSDYGHGLFGVIKNGAATSVGTYDNNLLYSCINNVCTLGGIETGGVGNRFHIALSPHRLRNYDGTERILERPYTPSGGTLCLFGNRGDVRIYDAEIYDGTTLVSKCIPARRDSDGTLGMYDTINNRFLANSGDGVIAGPIQNLYLPSGN